MTPDTTTASTHELAYSMMRLWGRDARTMARNYALDCWRQGDAATYMRWHSVEWHIEQAQTGTQAYQGTVSGQQPEPARRRRWFEIPLEAVMPAIRRLGGSAMRGTGLF
jgi:hypothetical protein